MGRRLAVVSREAAMYAVRVFDASTGALIAEFPGHASTVYDVQWAPERAGGAHAAGDNASALWTSPRRDARAHRQRRRRGARLASAREGEDAGGEAAASAFDIVAQHACGCYSAAWHPTAPGVLATGARDGGVRLWATENAGGGGGARNARVVAAGRGRPPASPPPPWPSTARACGCGWGSRTASCASTGWTSRAAARVRARAVAARVRKRAAGRADHLPTRRAHRPAARGLRPPTAPPPWT